MTITETQTVVTTKTADEVRTEQLLFTLAELGGKGTAEEDIVFEGTRLVIPATLDIKGALKMLKRKLDADEEVTDMPRKFRFRPHDGARATAHALKKAFGIVDQQPIATMFGNEPPQLMEINIGVGETEMVPWGAIAVPHLPGLTLYTGAWRDPEMGQLFRLVAQGPRKYRFYVEGIFRLVENELATDSMYRGKAFDGRSPNPEFLDLSGVDPRKVIYSDDVVRQLSGSIWSCIEHAGVMRANGVPLKKAALLFGPYGTGKTLAAYLTAQVAVKNGWTFVYCRPAKDSLEDVVATAQLYQPAVVFMEDVDTVADGEDKITRVLDIFDGINAKGTEILMIVTTNHVEKIHKGMVRPGRLDSMIEIAALDHQGIRRMVESMVPENKLGDISDDEWEEIGVSMDGYLPAFIREAIDRAVRYNIDRNGGHLTELAAPDFVAAADGLRPQFSIMEDAKDSVERDPVAVALSDVVQRAVHGVKVDTETEDDSWARLSVDELVEP